MALPQPQPVHHVEPRVSWREGERGSAGGKERERVSWREGERGSAGGKERERVSWREGERGSAGGKREREREYWDTCTEEGAWVNFSMFYVFLCASLALHNFFLMALYKYYQELHKLLVLYMYNVCASVLHISCTCLPFSAA